MKIEEFLAKLEGVQNSGSGKWVARCPAHDDHNPSLGVAVGDDGRILVKCYAGCSAESIVSAMGLKMSDLMPESAGRAEDVRAAKAPPAVSAADLLSAKPTEPKKRDFGKLVESYDYQDASGSSIYRVERRVKADGKKTFVQMRKDPESRYGWSYGLAKGGVARVPYRLPRILAAGKAGKSVIVVEGEKDVHAVERTLGIVATCNAGGAGKWESGWGKYFEGVRCVVIIADKDALKKKNAKTGAMEIHAVGQRHACSVEQMLRADGYKGVIRKLYMPDVGNVKVKDYSDWVSALEKAGQKADKEAFQKVINGFEGWPEEWEFSGGDLVDLGKVKGDADEKGASAEKGRGRFGAPRPRTPAGKQNGWSVDFDIGGGKFVELRIEQDWSIAQIFGYSYYAIAKKCPRNEVPKDVPPRLKAWSAAIWLLMRGSFFWDAASERDFEKTLYLDRDPKACRLMRVMSNEFFAFVGAAAKLEDIEPKRGDMAKILGIVKQVSVDPEYSKAVTPGNSWQRFGDVIYISSGDTEMVRIDKEGCKLVQNGTDGVVFLRGNTLAPWTLEDGEGLDPFAVSPIFRDASWVEASGVMNVRIWMLNLFACHKTKPILLVTGKAQSGKTRLARAIKEIIGVRKNGVDDSDPLDVEDGDKGREAFWVAVHGGKLEIFDNLDTKIRWVANTFQAAATGGSLKRRALYKDESEIIMRSNASIVVTSNNPLFSTDGDGGMADRMITANLKPRMFTDEHSVENDIVVNRSKYLTWMARTLSKALADTGVADKSINKRHPDYGMFSLRLGRALGCEAEVVRAMGAAEIEKALLPLKNDIIMSAVLKVLQFNEEPWKMRFTSGEMAEKIIAMQGDEIDERTKQMFSARRVGKAFSRYARQMSEVFKMEQPRLYEGRTLYEIQGLSAAGELALKQEQEVDSVGSVDLKATFPENPIYDGRRGGLCDIPPLNPPNPPYARVHEDISLSCEEKKEEENEIEDISLEGFEL
jgi:hypothetical protein